MNIQGISIKSSSIKIIIISKISNSDSSSIIISRSISKEGIIISRSGSNIISRSGSNSIIISRSGINSSIISRSSRNSSIFSNISTNKIIIRSGSTNKIISSSGGINITSSSGSINIISSSDNMNSSGITILRIITWTWVAWTSLPISCFNKKACFVKKKFYLMNEIKYTS